MTLQQQTAQARHNARLHYEARAVMQLHRHQWCLADEQLSTRRIELMARIRAYCIGIAVLLAYSGVMWVIANASMA